MCALIAAVHQSWMAPKNNALHPVCVCWVSPCPCEEQAALCGTAQKACITWNDTQRWHTVTKHTHSRRRTHTHTHRHPMLLMLPLLSTQRPPLLLCVGSLGFACGTRWHQCYNHPFELFYIIWLKQLMCSWAHACVCSCLKNDPWEVLQLESSHSIQCGFFL